MSPYLAGPNAFVDGVLQHLGINRNSALPPKVDCNLQVDIAFNFQLGTGTSTVNTYEKIGRTRHSIEPRLQESRRNLCSRLD